MRRRGTRRGGGVKDEKKGGPEETFEIQDIEFV